MTKIIGKIQQVKKLRNSLHLTKEGKKKVADTRTRLQDIISGKSKKNDTYNRSL